MQRWLIKIHVLLNIVIRYMAVIATGTRAKAALVIVALRTSLAWPDRYFFFLWGREK